MMNHWYDSMGAGDWLVMSVLWVALIVLVVSAVAQLFPHASRTAPDLAERPEEILDRRLAAGEIDVAGYDALRGKLHQAHTGRA